jgi:segregation and condensation protein B
METVNHPTNAELDTAALLESLLFVASGPVSADRLAKSLELPASYVLNVLRSMDEEYQKRGLRMQWSGSLVQLTTAPESSAAVERFLGLEVTTRLSQAAVEVLAITAFLQPTTRPQIDQIRGVNSDTALKTLLSFALVEEIGRKDTPGRPILYGTTPDFLQYFGLQSLSELHPLSEEEE